MVRIGGSTPSSPVGKPSSGKGKQTAGKSGKRDNIQVSDSASLRERAKVMLADLPDVRLDKIEGIRSALENGSYKTDSKKISAYIVRNALSEHTWG